MAERKVSGADLLLFIDPLGGTSYSLVVCLTSQSMTRVTNEIDAKSKCGPDKSFGTKEVGIDFEGQVIYSAAASRLGIFELHELWEDNTVFSWKYGRATPVEGDVVYTGMAFLSKLDETAGQDDVATFSASLGIQGSVTAVKTPA